MDEDSVPQEQKQKIIDSLRSETQGLFTAEKGSISWVELLQLSTQIERNPAIREYFTINFTRAWNM